MWKITLKFAVTVLAMATALMLAIALQLLILSKQFDLNLSNIVRTWSPADITDSRDTFLDQFSPQKASHSLVQSVRYALLRIGVPKSKIDDMRSALRTRSIDDAMSTLGALGYSIDYQTISYDDLPQQGELPVITEMLGELFVVVHTASETMVVIYDPRSNEIIGLPPELFVAQWTTRALEFRFDKRPSLVPRPATEPANTL